MYQELIQEYGAPDATVVDNWWSSESGSPISGISIAPRAADSWETRTRSYKPLSVKPGSAGKAAPGFDVRVVDDNGNEVKRGKMGNIVLAIPLAPTGFTSLWKDEDKFYSGYLERFGGKWIDTGGRSSQTPRCLTTLTNSLVTDAGMIDAHGYISIMSRSDDLINTAGHRLSTGMPRIILSSKTILIGMNRLHRTGHNKPPTCCRS